MAATGITAPFPIQSATLPDSLRGRDVLGRGRTGSGKTLAFVLPVLVRLAASAKPRTPGRPRALILAPTRELATQIHDTLEPLAKGLRLRSATVFGGVGANPQISALRAGLDVLVACPGRLEDHIRSGHARLDAVEITVLDEADHMADLGFLPVVKRLLDLTPAQGQRLLFSATLDNGINQLVQRFLHDPVTHSVDSAQSPISTMSHHVLHLAPEHRLPVLVDLAAAPGRTIMFTRTKHGARKLAKQLVAANIPAVELHGNLAHNARTRNLAAFSTGEATTLVATDIAARGIHVDDVTLVVHADPPVEHKAYLHRSGRTARAGASGTVITLMTDAQRSEVRDLTRKAGISPTTTRLSPGDPLLKKLAPGERTFADPEAMSGLMAASTAPEQPRRRGQQSPRSASRSGQRSASTATAKQIPGQRSRSAADGGMAAPRSGSSKPNRSESSAGQSRQSTQAKYSSTANPRRPRRPNQAV
ncbi:MAG: DEAD/DEAH box helicase [Actinocrinis sp.]